MFNYVKNSLSKLIKSRLIVLVVLFALLAGILIQRLYTMQIINGEKYLTDFTMQIKKETTLKSTRGNIYDRDGNAVAYNKLAYNVTYEDVGSYDTTRERNLAMNGSLYQIMKVIEDGGDQVYTNYAIDIGSDGQYEFTREGFNLLRFRADIFGYADTEDLKTDERNCTAEEMMQTLSTKKWYGIDLSVYTEEELQEYGLPSSFTKEEQLKLTALRSAVAQNSYQKYVTTTIAKDISKDTVAVIMENKDRYPGVDVEEDSIRVYEDGLYMAPLIGYTGQVSAEELEELNGENGNGQYSSSDIVGKSGLEKYFEKELRGQNGTKTVYVDNLGKVLKEDSEVAPQAGNDIHLTIDRNLHGGVGLICETEADTVSTAIGGDHGHWSDLLRKCFDHDRLAYNRRTNHEYRECNVTFLCVLLSGTPAQIKPLIPSAENGLFSRQLFYYMPAIEEWEDQFNEADTDYDSRFLEWGAQWKEVLDAITASVSNINMKLTHEQKEIFNFHFARVFGRASAIHGNQMKSAVTRIAINIFRIISIIALLRSLESLLPGGERSGEPQENIVRTLLDCPGLTPSAHIPQENIADGIVPQFNLSIRTDDFYAVLALVEPLYRHACHILSLLPAGTPTAPSANMTPETLFDCLPLRFTRNEAIDKGEQVGVPAGSVDSLLKRMTERGQLVKVGRGEYEFNARMHTRTCVGVRESASSASLQDS